MRFKVLPPLFSERDPERDLSELQRVQQNHSEKPVDILSSGASSLRRLAPRSTQKMSSDLNAAQVTNLRIFIQPCKTHAAYRYGQPAAVLLSGAGRKQKPAGGA